MTFASWSSQVHSHPCDLPKTKEKEEEREEGEERKGKEKNTVLPLATKSKEASFAVVPIKFRLTVENERQGYCDHLSLQTSPSLKKQRRREAIGKGLLGIVTVMLKCRSSQLMASGGGWDQGGLSFL